jgi:carboxyl-terminal processing protease
LPATVIEANKYYKPLSPLPVAAAEVIAKKEMASSPYFKYVQQYIEQAKAAKVRKDFSLLIEEAWQEKKKKEQQAATLKAPAQPEKAIYTVVNPAASQKQRERDSELNDEWKENLLSDAYVKIAFQLIATMK